MDQISFAACRTPSHHFGVWFPGKITDLSLTLAMHRMFKNDRTVQLYDGAHRFAPLGLLFTRDCDRVAWMELLAPYGFTYTVDESGMFVADWHYP